ncbi:M15 family metallopeptidase [Blastococcus sp. SYSU D00813]
MPPRLRAALLAVPLLLAGLSACSDPTTGTATEVAADGTALTVQDGYVPHGAAVSPFADVPAVTRLEPDLRAALQAAARAAAEDGVDLYVTSGWRSAAYQQALFDAAVAEHGSVEDARAFVLRPEESEHVTGRAVDIGPPAATSWMQQHGAGFGLCQTYGNEPWHHELATTPGTACPPPLADARAG